MCDDPPPADMTDRWALAAPPRCLVDWIFRGTWGSVGRRTAGGAGAGGGGLGGFRFPFPGEGGVQTLARTV